MSSPEVREIGIQGVDEFPHPCPQPLEAHCSDSQPDEDELTNFSLSLRRSHVQWLCVKACCAAVQHARERMRSLEEMNEDRQSYVCTSIGMEGRAKNAERLLGPLSGSLGDSHPPKNGNTHGGPTWW